MTAEGGEARNHEAEREAVARALVPTGIGTWEELSSLQRSHYRQDADIAIAALDAVRRSPQGEAVAVLTRLRIELTNTSLDGSDATRIVDRALAYFTGNGPSPYEVVHGVGNVPAGRSPQGEDHGRWIEPHDALKYELGDPMDAEQQGEDHVERMRELADSVAERTERIHAPQGEDHEAGKYVCPNGHRILAEKTVLCDECPGLTVYVPMSRLIEERERGLSRYPSPERRRWTLAGYRQRVEVDAGPPIREGERIEVEEVPT